MSEEQVPAEGVEGLAPVELPPDAPPESLVGEPAEGVVGALQLAVLDQGFGQGVLAGSGLEAGHEQGGRDVAGPDGPGDAEQVVPVPVDHLDLGGVGEEGPAGGHCW